MNYEKMYKEALEDMRVIYPNLKGDAKLAVEHAFPELAESENERIRKEIVSALKFANDGGVYDKHIAYLEKQKECLADNSKMSADEDESIRKFLVDFFASYKIGDAATKLNGVRIDDILAYLEKQKDLDKMIVVTPEVWDNAINEAYENGKMDSEKQKENRMQPVYDNQESFESALEKAWKSYNDSGARTVDSCEDDYVECAHAKGFREGFLFGVGKNNEALGALLTETYKSGVRDGQKQKEQKPYEPHNWPADKDNLTQEQKPEWSEEDERMLNNLIWAVHMKSISPLDEMDDRGKYERYEKFLTSLPERFSLQPKQEWSKEDEDFINMLILHFNYLIEKGGDSVETYKSYREKLKSLRPQYHGDVTMTEAYKMGKEAGKASHWKPSEDEERLINTSISFLKDFADKGYENAVECIDWLKSKLNGDSGK